jgi:hypothetical protein
VDLDWSEKQYTSVLGKRENSSHFGDFPQLSMIIFDRVGSVYQAADLSRISKESNQLFPVVFPRSKLHILDCANLVDNATLNLGFGKDHQDCFL